MPLNPFSKPIRFRISVDEHNISNLNDLKNDFPVVPIISEKITIKQLANLLRQSGENDIATKLEPIGVRPIINDEDIIKIIQIVYEDLNEGNNNPLTISLKVLTSYRKSGLNLLSYFLGKRPELADDLIKYHKAEVDSSGLSFLYEKTRNDKLKPDSINKTNVNQKPSINNGDVFAERDYLEGKNTKNGNESSFTKTVSEDSAQFQNSVNDLRKLLDINTPIISICDHDFVRVDKIIKEAASDNIDEILEWTPGLGSCDFRNKKAFRPSFSYLNKEKGNDDSFPTSSGKIDLISFLDNCLNNIGNNILILKDVHLFFNEQMQSTEVYQTAISLLHSIAQNKLYNGPTQRNKHGFHTTIIIVNSVPIIFPKELTQYVSYFDIPRPDDEEIERLIQHHLYINKASLSGDKKKIILSLKGLSSFEIDRALDMAISENGDLTDKDTKLITAQKKNMIKNSGLLELIETSGNIDEIGGLSHLKAYLKKKGSLMTNYKDALDYGVSMPKGIMLVGMPGCGKSMCAQAASCLFENIPLLKMDIGNLQGQYVGQSEANMREAIKMAEAAAPCILWIDEIEKAFAGISSGTEAYTTRMFGSFLSWMQDKKSQVYIIATANNIENLPAEFKRKGRFDEIFCMDLPDKNECLKIFDAQLSNKRRKCKKLSEFVSKEAIDYRVKILNKVTGHCNGADINAIIDIALENLFYNGSKKQNIDDKILANALWNAAESTVGIYGSCKEQIDNMRKEFAKNSFVNATTGKISQKL